MMQDICAHNGEGCLFLKCFEDISHTDSTRRTISCDVCEKTTYPRTQRTTGVRMESLVVKLYCANYTYLEAWSRFGVDSASFCGTDENVWTWRSECYENNVCSHRHMHPISWTNDVDFGKDILFVLGSSAHFSHNVLPSFFSQLCDHVVIKTEWSSQSEQMDLECRSAPWRLWLRSSGVLPAQHRPGVLWGEYGTRITHKGAQKCRHWSKYHESEYMVQGINSRRWRSSLVIIKPCERSCFWNKQVIILGTRAKWIWWRKTRDEEVWHASTSAQASWQSEDSKRSSTTRILFEVKQDTSYYLWRRLHTSMVF